MPAPTTAADAVDYLKFIGIPAACLALLTFLKVFWGDLTGWRARHLRARVEIVFKEDIAKRDSYWKRCDDGHARLDKLEQDVAGIKHDITGQLLKLTDAVYSQNAAIARLDERTEMMVLRGTRASNGRREADTPEGHE